MQSQQIEINQDISCIYTPEELKIVIACLKKGPYEKVAPILNSMERQILMQLKPVENTTASNTMPASCEQRQ